MCKKIWKSNKESLPPVKKRSNKNIYSKPKILQKKISIELVTAEALQNFLKNLKNKINFVFHKFIIKLNNEVKNKWCPITKKNI